jgi:hypothetical protein
MKTKFSLSSAALAGLIATTAMTLITFMAPLMGIEMNIPLMLASTFGAPIIIGWIMHFMIGTILAINFAAIFLPKFGKSNPALSGTLFSIIPWLMAQVVVMPMMVLMNGGSYINGFFSGSIALAFASLIGHIVYGLVLGYFYKPAPIINLNPTHSS